jgi:hypothetical protein
VLFIACTKRVREPGYAISGERTLETFYERVQPFALAFMALFGRDRLPARSTLSRFLAALDQAPVEALLVHDPKSGCCPLWGFTPRLLSSRRIS